MKTIRHTLGNQSAAELLADDRKFLELYVRQAAYGGYPGAKVHAAQRIPVLRARIAQAETELAAAGREAAQGGGDGAGDGVAG
jgi:hypothetical protein